MIEIGDAWTFEPSCAVFAETDGKPIKVNSARVAVTGTVDFIHYAHGWFRVSYRLPGIPNEQHECFRMPSPCAEPAPIKYGYRHGDGRRGAYDTKYNNK